MSDLEKLNPSIKTTAIGVRELRDVNVYPLSLGDELKLSKIITETLQFFYNQKEEDSELIIAKEEELNFDSDDGNDVNADSKTVTFFLEQFTNNIGVVISMCLLDEITDVVSAEDIMNDITNEQAVDLAAILYEANYSGQVKKKVIQLLAKVKGKLKEVKKQVK